MQPSYCWQKVKCRRPNHCLILFPSSDFFALFSRGLALLPRVSFPWKWCYWEEIRQGSRLWIWWIDASLWMIGGVHGNCRVIPLALFGELPFFPQNCPSSTAVDQSLPLTSPEPDASQNPFPAKLTMDIFEGRNRYACLGIFCGPACDLFNLRVLPRSVQNSVPRPPPSTAITTCCQLPVMF